MDREVTQQVMAVADRDMSGTIEWLEFLSCIPFFEEVHEQVVRNPLVPHRSSLDEAMPHLKNDLA